MVAAILEGGRVTINVAKLRELHQPMYGHTGDPCSWCREWTPCPVTELLDVYEEREQFNKTLAAVCDTVIGRTMSDTAELTADIVAVSKEVATLQKRYRDLQLKAVDAEEELREAVGRLNFLTAQLLENR